MKKILFILAIVYCFSIPHTVSQIDLDDIVGAVKDGFGKSVETAEKDADSEAMQKKIKAEFSDKFKKWEEFTNNLDHYSTQTKCLYTMAKYILEFEKLKKQTKATSDCKKKYDLYGMQQMMLMSSTSIMFCTEELYNKTTLFAMALAHDNGANIKLPKDFSYEDDIEPYFQPIKEELIELHKNIETGNKEMKYTDFEKTLYQFYGLYHILKTTDDGHTGVDILAIHKLLETYFHPLALAKEVMAISKEMYDLKPCANH